MVRTSHYFLFLLAASLPASTWARNYIVGVENTSVLPIGDASNDQYIGYGRDLLDAFAKKYGHIFTYKAYPGKRLWNEYLVTQSVDFRFPDNQVWAKDLKHKLPISYSSGVITMTDGLMVKPANKGLDIERIKRISMVRGFSPSAYQQRIEAGKIEVNEVSSVGAAIGMVVAGRVDAAYVNIQSATYMINEILGKPGMAAYDDSLPHTHIERSLSSINHPEVIKQLNDFLATEKAILAKLKTKYRIAE